VKDNFSPFSLISAKVPKNMNQVPSHRIVIVDDSPSQCLVWREFLKDRYKNIQVETYTDPLEALEHLTPDLSLLLIDWYMPGMDGKQVLEEAKKKGINPEKIIMISVKSARELHEAFEPGDCLAVIEKMEPAQLGALLHILDEMFM